MRYHLEATVMGGALKEYSGAEELLNGFESDVASRVNGGLYYAGNDFSLSS